MRSALGLAGDAPLQELAAALRRAASEIEERAGVSQQSASAAKGEESRAAAAAATAADKQPPQPSPPPRRQTRRERRASTDSAWERRRAGSRSSVCAIPPSEFPLRPVALEVLYLGWAFRGFTTQTSVSSDLVSSAAAAAASAGAASAGALPRRQGPSKKEEEWAGDDGTVEAQLFRALRRTGLVPCLAVKQPGEQEQEQQEEEKQKMNGRGDRGGGDGGENGGAAEVESPPPPPHISSSFEAPTTWKDLGYARCGRTDAGVSGMGQVVSLRLRSKLRRFQKVEKKKKVKEKEKEKEKEVKEKRSGGVGDDDDDDGGGLFAPSSCPCSSSSSDPEEREEQEADSESDSDEIDYPSLLNKALPPEVRVTGWCPLPGDNSFSARFSATAREYRYFFVDDCCRGGASRGGGGASGLDLRAMREAAAALVGLHDFRNVCKPDLPSVTNFVRRVYSCEVEEWAGALDDPFFVPRRKETGGGAGGGKAAPCSSSSAAGDAAEEEEDDGDNDKTSSPSSPPQNHLLGSSPSAARFRGYVLRIRGAAFLLHQVRCVASLLLMVGRGQEQPSVVARLLDVAATPRKPHYDLAPPEALLFSGCDFGPLSLAWRRSERALDQARLSVRELLRGRVAGVALLGAAAARLDQLAREAAAEAAAEAEAAKEKSSSLFPEPPLPAAITRRHVPLFQRGSDPPLEERAAAKGFALTTGAAPRRPARFFASPSLAEA